MADVRSHPAGTVTPLPAESRRDWIAVGAALDSEKAVEYTGDDNRTYGAFTWFWVRALQSCRPTDTWQMVHEKTRALMRSAEVVQTPSLEGDIRTKIFGGKLEEIPRNFTVTGLLSSGEVILNAGIFSGISANSEFRLADADGKPSGAVLVVREVDLYTCTTTVSGGVPKAGDTAVLTRWRPNFAPIKIAVQTAMASDAPLASTLKDFFKGDRIPFYELTDSPGESRMVLWVVRPRTNDRGEVLMQKGSGLPESSATADPQVWVMEPSQVSFYNRRENLKAPLNEEGLEVLCSNLERLARLYDLQNMRCPEGSDGGLSLEYKLFVPATETEWSGIPKGERLKLGVSYPHRKWKLNRIVPASGVDVVLQPEERVLAVRASNRSRQTYHIYAVNATPDAMILPFLPRDTYQVSTEVLPGKDSDFEGALILESEQEYVRVLATIKPVNIHILAQSALETNVSETKLATRSGIGNFSSIGTMLFEQLYSVRRDNATPDLNVDDLFSRGNFFLGGQTGQ
jgi:hypothetical protein